MMLANNGKPNKDYCNNIVIVRFPL